MAVDRKRLLAMMPKEFRDVCERVSHHGWQRVILLGEDVRRDPWSLRACLAQMGTLVLTPGPQDRAWVQELALRAAQGQVGTAERARFAALLADGVEHGVDALLATDALLGGLAREAAPELPLLEPERDAQ